MVDLAKQSAAIIHSSEDAIVSKTLDGVIVSWNKAAEKLFGFSAAEMVGRRMLSLFPSGNLDEEDHILATIQRGDRIEHFKSQRLHKSGRLVDVSVSVSPIFDEDGNIVGASSIARDITLQTQEQQYARHLESIIRYSDDAIISKTLDGVILSWNVGAERVFGYSAKEMIGERMIKIFPSDRIHEEDDILAKLARGESIEHFRTQRMHKDGRLIEVSVSISPIKDDSGKVVGASKIARDVTKWVAAEQQIAQYKALVEGSEDGIISKSLDGVIQTWNKAAEKIFGYTEKEAVGNHITMLFPPERISEEQKLLRSVLAGTPVNHFKSTRIRKDGRKIFVSVSLSPIYDSRNQVCGFSKIVRDITAEIEQESRYWRNVNYDSQTGLFNRQGMMSCIEEHIQLSQVRNLNFAIVNLDMENLRPFLETQSAEFNDKLLRRIADVLRATIRWSDDVARMGNLEFTLCLLGFENIDNLRCALGKIHEHLKAITDIDGMPVVLRPRMGVSIFPEDGNLVNTLLRRADHALYNAIQNGGDQYQLYSGVLQKDLRKDNAIVRDLRDAINSEGQLSLMYQPIIDSKTMEISKVEALVRWHHPTMGFVSPLTFVPLAEKYGLIHALDNWVMNEAMHQLERWTERYGLGFQVSINKSPYDLVDMEEEISNLKRQLHARGLMGNNLIVEITEHSLLADSPVAQNILHEYSRLGVQVALDDFGTGYSSLSYLKNYPVQLLKIDKSFVDTFLVNETNFVVVDAVVKIAKKLGIKVVAEGIEEARQLSILHSLGCDFYQGYFFSKPLTVAELDLAMTDWPARKLQYIKEMAAFRPPGRKPGKDV